VSVETFLKQRAVNIAVNGSYSLERRWYDADGKLRSFACRTSRVSPFRMMVEVPVVGRIGERYTSYFREFGELEGTISHTVRGGFLVDMEMTAERRSRFAEQLAWLERKLADASIQDSRGDARIIPPASHSVMILADGSMHGCFIIDISPTGCGVSAEIQLPLGTPLAIGACVGRVVRVFETGFAVKFVERQDIDDLSRLIVVQPRRTATLAEERIERAFGQPTAQVA
jgi:PilZ domain